MDKIINNGYQCSLNGMTDDTALVTVIEGNDVTLDIQLTKYDVDEEIWKSYSLYDKEDVQCYLLTPNGTHIDLDTEVQLDGKLKAKAESYQLETNMTYGIGVDWKDDDNDLSVKAKGMVKVVRYSEVTEDYDIAVTDNATYISLGQLPQDAITPDELTVVLDNYVTNSSLSTTLEDYVQDSELDNYVTDTDLSTVLEDYVDETELSSTLSSYVSDNQLSSTLQLYATTQYVDDAIEDIDIDTSNFYTKTEIDTTLQSYVLDSELSTTLTNYVTDSELNTTLNPYITEIELDSTLGTTLNAYATSISIDGEHLIVGPSISKVISLKNSSNESISAIDLPAISVFNNNGTLNVKPANTSTGLIKAADARKIYEDSIRIDDVESDITSLDGRVTTLEQNPSVPSNVVTSDDANEIVLLTQSEYDALVSGGTVDPDALYYITDTTSDYVTNSEMTSAINTAIAGVTIDETNLVHKTGSERISGTKTFSANNSFNGDNTFSGESKFIFSSRGLNYTDNLYEISKSSLFARGSFLQACIGQILAPNTVVTDSINKYDNQVDTILFQKVDGSAGDPNFGPSSLTTLAKIDTNGIYEGTTLLSDKYALKSEIPTSSGVSEEDWDNSNEAIAKELTDNRLEHISINNNFNNYYNKTESDSRYATQSWAVSQTDNENQNQAIAAAFASSVQSTTIHNIVQISQTDYDALTTKDTNTLYIII